MISAIRRFSCAAMALLAGLTACGQEETAVQQVIRPVRYVQVYSTGGMRMRTFSGTARAGIEANLSFKVGGTVEKVAVQVGDTVEAGETIAQLDRQDYELQLQRAGAAYDQATAGLNKARADYERIRGLYENNNASRSDLDATRAAFESATASVESAEKQRELARLQLSYTRLTAPSDGSIASVNVEVNENVQPGQRIVMLTSGSDIEVDVAIPEVLISSVKEESDVEVRFDAIPAKKYDGFVNEVGVASTGFATTYPVTVRLQGKPEEVRSGMAAEVTFRFGAADQGEHVFVPSVAVGEDRLGRFVFVVHPMSGDTATVKRVPVEVGGMSAEGLEISNGLADGDLVVTAGVSKIKDGQKVRL